MLRRQGWCAVWREVGGPGAGDEGWGGHAQYVSIREEAAVGAPTRHGLSWWSVRMSLAGRHRRAIAILHRRGIPEHRRDAAQFIQRDMAEDQVPIPRLARRRRHRVANRTHLARASAGEAASGWRVEWAGDL